MNWQINAKKLVKSNVLEEIVEEYLNTGVATIIVKDVPQVLGYRISYFK